MESGARQGYIVALSHLLAPLRVVLLLHLHLLLQQLHLLLSLGYHLILQPALLLLLEHLLLHRLI